MREIQKISGEQFINLHRKKICSHNSKLSFTKALNQRIKNLYMIKGVKIFGELFMVNLEMKLIFKFKISKRLKANKIS